VVFDRPPWWARSARTGTPWRSPQGLPRERIDGRLGPVITLRRSGPGAPLPTRATAWVCTSWTEPRNRPHRAPSTRRQRPAEAAISRSGWSVEDRVQVPHRGGRPLRPGGSAAKPTRARTARIRSVGRTGTRCRIRRSRRGTGGRCSPGGTT
jgi:hypothetical protein